MPTQVIRAGIGCLFGLALVVATTHAGVVFKIRAGQCALQPRERALTGFVVDGHAGIVTALHGVADCDEITAQPSSQRLALVMRVDRQDAATDTALLVPKDAAEAAKLTSPLESFAALPPAITLATDLPVTALGYPHGVVTMQKNSSLKIGAPPTERLGDILGTQNADIVERRSPDVDLQVIKLVGLVVKGESGAPVIVPSSSDRVAGLIVGSPDPGSSNIAWVVPIGAIKWASFDPNAWKTVRLPNSLASAVGLPEEGPTEVYQLELSHGPQTIRESKAFPVAFADESIGVSTVHQEAFWASEGATFEEPLLEASESVGVAGSDVQILEDGRIATFNVLLRTTRTTPRASFKGTVRLVEVRNVAPQSTTRTVAVRQSIENGMQTGEAQITADTTGQWETFTLRDSSGRIVATGPVGETVAGQTQVGVASAGPTVSVGIKARPMPPPTIRVH